MSTNAEQIKFQVAGAYDEKPLQAMVRDLKAAEEMVEKLNAALASGLPSGLRKSQAEIRGLLEKMPAARAGGRGEKMVGLDAIASALGERPDQMAGWMAKNIAAKTGGYMPREQLFRSVKKAEKAIGAYIADRMNTLTTGTLAALMRGGGGGGGGGPMNAGSAPAMNPRIEQLRHELAQMKRDIAALPKFRGLRAGDSPLDEGEAMARGAGRQARYASIRNYRSKRAELRALESGATILPGSAVRASVTGEIKLIIPAKQIVATVSGEVAAKGTGAPGAGAGGAGGGGGGGGAGGGGGKRRALGTLPDDLGAGVTATSLLDTGKKQILTVSRREGARRLITEKYDVESKDLLSTTLTDPSAQAALRRFNLLKRQAASEVSRAQAGLRGRPQPEVLTGMNAAALAAQQRLQGFVGSPDFDRLPADVQAEVLEEVSRLGQGYEARGIGYARQGQNAQAKTAAAAEKERLKTEAAKITARWHRDTGAATGDAWGTQAAQVNRYRDLAELFAGDPRLSRVYASRAWQAQGKLDLVGKGLQGQALGRWVGQQSLLARSDRAAALAAGTAVGDNLRAGMAYHNRMSGALMAAADLAEGQQAEKFYNAALSHWEKADTLAKRIAGLKPPKPSSRAPGGGSPADQQRGLVSHGLSGFTPTGFLKNLGTVTGWGLAANTAMQGFNFVGDSGARAMQIETQTARLGQIFRGVGGSAQQLTSDVLKLAAAEGRSSDEAMESAVQWSRLGLTRKQVNEAVRTSLVAANVAEISASEATEHLSSLMAVYGLRVSELNSALGMLNQTSNTLNVTNKDLLDGLSRSAGVAKQAGMGFAELQGHIAAIVSATGQTGTMAGNAMKSILVSLSDPTVQDQLRTRFGISVADTEGKLSMGRLWSGYQGLSPQQQQQVNLLVAGKNQATRFVADMDNYVLAVRKAYEAQLNLNSAEKENVLIKQTLQKQLTGLRSEWDVLVNTVGTREQPLLGGRSLLGTGSDIARAWRLTLRAFNDPYAIGENLGAALGLAGGEEGRNAGRAGWQSFNRILGRTPLGWPRQLWNLAERFIDPQGRSENQREKYLASAGGATGLANALETMLPGVRGAMSSREGRDRLAGQMGAFTFSAVSAGELEAAIRLNDVSRAQLLIEREITAQREIGRQALRQQDEELQKQIALYRGRTDPESVAMLAELQGKRHNVQAEQEEFLEPLAAVRRRGLVRAMDQIRTGGIATLFGQFRPGTAYTEEQQRIALELATAQGKLDTLGRSNLTGSAADLQVQAGLREEANRLQQGATGRAADLRLSVARLHDRRGFWDQSARFEAGQYAVGLTPGEQMLGQMRFLQGPAARGPLAPGGDQDATTQLSRVTQLYETQRGVLERIVTLTREQKQLTIEIGHENSKALLISSPGERLRRVAVGNLVRSGRLGAAQMMALDPGAANMAFEMMGGDTGYRQRRELAALTSFRTPEEVLASPLLTEEAKAAYRRGDRRLVQRDIAEVRAGRISQQQIELAEAYARNRAPHAAAQNAAGQAAVLGDGLDELDKVARKTAEGLSRATDASQQFADMVMGMVNPALQMFADKLMSHVMGGNNVPAVPPRDVNTGYKQQQAAPPSRPRIRNSLRF